MPSFRTYSFLFLSATSLALGQTIPSATEDHENIVKLDSYVVTAGAGDKTAFDLAQGTSILSGDELRRRTATTLGETLSDTPGVNSTYYGPGASRPIIRGLGGDRIRVLQDGVGALDASNISPDHNTAIEPLFADRIEVLRGPSTLLYGSSAVGGVVNVIDNRIPTHALGEPFTGAIETRAFGAGDERTTIASVAAGTDGFAVRVNGLSQRSGDVDIPGVARIDPAAPANQPVGTLPNSAIDTESLSVGAGWFGRAGHLGLAVSRYVTDYGVPVDEPISISMRQSRLDLNGELTQPFGIFTGLRGRFGLGDYTHSEISDHTTVNTTFKNRAWEGRTELPFAFSATTSGTIGVQASRSDFSAVGDEVVTPAYVNNNEALFALNEWKYTAFTFQLGGRVEHQNVQLGDVDPTLPPVPGFAAQSGEQKRFTGTSGSTGLVFYPAKDWSLGLSLAYTERLPTAQELFSNGPHGGTNAWEIGNSGLGLEKSTGVDLSLRKRAGFVTGSLSVFVNRFQNYIFEQELPLAAIPAADNPESLTPYQFTAKDADFRGAEADVTFHLAEGKDWHLHLNLMADTVRAEQTTDHQPLPRIPPLRYGTGLHYENARWTLGAEVRRAAEQDRVAPGETTTPGYTLLSANISYRLPLGRDECEFFLRGANLTDTEARVHTSFLKDFSPLPGRGITAGARLTF
ncbi:MAG: TonB-dependent receptor [Verrucomicrobia bacterium]|nr:TonB-dependent receptor [Verrucomicrobiota bacterium]